MKPSDKTKQQNQVTKTEKKRRTKATKTKAEWWTETEQWTEAKQRTKAERRTKAEWRKVWHRHALCNDNRIRNSSLFHLTIRLHPVWFDAAIQFDIDNENNTTILNMYTITDFFFAAPSKMPRGVSRKPWLWETLLLGGNGEVKW